MIEATDSIDLIGLIKHEMNCYCTPIRRRRSYDIKL